MKSEIKQEASVPIASRINVVSLAELDMYWMSEGRHIRTMSQLVAWSVELLCEVLRANEKLPKGIDSVAEAHKYMLERGMYQPSLKDRGFKKIGTAIKFENMREEGEDPSVLIGSKKEPENKNVNRQYNMLHNERSVRPFRGRVDREITREMLEIYNNTEPSGLFDDLSSIREKVMREHTNIREGMSEEEARAKIKELDNDWEQQKAQMDELLKSGCVKGKDEIAE
jgi:hypothetical protein